MPEMISAPISSVEGHAPAPSTRRGLVYLALAAIFAAAILRTMLWPNGETTAAPPCAAGATISQAAVTTGASGADRLFAVVRPPAAPNVALGNQPGCEALYASDDAGVTWTISFSATAEAPLTITPVDNAVYLLTQRVQFPLYLAGNLYRSDSHGAAWSWLRVSPQERHAVPAVSVTDIFDDPSPAILLRVANGDGAALLRSTDRGAHWQPFVIPGLQSANSVALQGSVIAVAPGTYVPAQSPGRVSTDGGATWSSLGILPGAPNRPDLRAVLSGSDVARAMVLELIPASAVAGTPVVARYASTDGGRSWSLARCGDRPAPGCAPSTRWAQTTTARYVLYRRRLFKAVFGQPWQPLPFALPVPSASVLQVLSVTNKSSDTLYLVAANAIWRLQDGAWRNVANTLGLTGPTPDQA
jgi:BNR/Asp-box repeat